MYRSRIVVTLALVLAVVPGAALAAPVTAGLALSPASDASEFSPDSPPVDAITSSPTRRTLPLQAASPPGTCFPGEGHRFDIGTEGPRIVTVMHLSMLTDPLNPGGFGVELTGTALNRTVITLQAGVRYDGIDDPGEFLRNPFAPFAYVSDYRLQLPMFSSMESASAYESQEPFSGPVERADC